MDVALRPGQVVPRDSLAGFLDKLYWRPSGQTWHCFKKLARADRGRGEQYVERYVSLCGDETRGRSDGQSCARPPAVLRCTRCDLAEIVRRGADESLDQSPNWREHQ